MKRFINVICLLTIVILLLLTGCSNNKSTETSIFYGEDGDWVIIGNTNNAFTFLYKGDHNDLSIDNPSSTINFFYGTKLGTVSAVKTINNSASYVVIFEEDFLSGLNLTEKSSFNDDDKLVNIQIKYGEKIDTINLSAYKKIIVNR